MKGEYLLFNLVVLLGPILASFEQRVHYVHHWKRAFQAATIAAVPFITWDILVSGRHWWFNPAYTLDLHLLGLPPGEWLFFFTVPFAAIFVWEVFGLRYSASPTRSRTSVSVFAALLLIIVPFLFLQGFEYTGLVMTVLAGVLVVDGFFGNGIASSRRFFLFLPLLLLMILIFNGYLTARPVVLYGGLFKSGWHIGTIPLEDFAYGLAHITLVLTLYEWLGRRRRG